MNGEVDGGEGKINLVPNKVDLTQILLSHDIRGFEEVNPDCESEKTKPGSDKKADKHQKFGGTRSLLMNRKRM